MNLEVKEDDSAFVFSHTKYVNDLKADINSATIQIKNPSGTELVAATNMVISGGDSETLTEDFANDTGFTYDNTKAEFSSGQVQQSDQRPSNAVGYASYTTNENLNWGGGTLTGTITGTASVSGGSLNVSAGTNNYVEYDAASNFASGNVGAVRLQFIPRYSGAPASNQYYFSSSSGENNIANLVRFIHIGTNLRWDVYDSSGTMVKTVQTGNSFSPVSGTTYEIELNFDTTNGEYRLFIDGALVNGLQTSAAGTRNQTTGQLRIGKDYTSVSNAVQEFEVLNVAFFDSVQHTAAYTPDWSNFTETIYVANEVELPVLTASESITSITSATFTETANPRYVIKIGTGNFQYWTGSAWADSDSTYAQANTSSDFNTNISSLTIPFNNTQLFIKAIFDGSNTQSAVSNIDVVIGQVGATATHTQDFSTDPSAGKFSIGRNYQAIIIVDGETLVRLFDIVKYPFINEVTIEDLRDENRQALDDIGYRINGDADSGSTTTLVDATKIGEETFLGGELEIYPTDNADRSSFHTITAFDSATGTFTFSPARGVAVATNAYTTRRSFAEDIKRSGEIVQKELWKKDRRAYLILDNSQIKDLIIYKFFERMYGRRRKAINEDNSDHVDFLYYSDLYRSDYDGLPLVYDLDEDGVIDNDERFLKDSVRFLR